MTVAEVVFNIPLERAFHYLIPANLQPLLQPGIRVVAPFGPRERVGFVVRRLSTSPIQSLKPIRRAIDPYPVMADEQRTLARWMADYYYCSFGEALFAMVPSDLRLNAQVAGPAAAIRSWAPPPGVDPPTRESPRHPPPGTRLHLSAHQQQALTIIVKALEARRARTVLLHGITGSGKTELYLRAIERVLRGGRGAICLVPEIALTPQTIDRFAARFGDRVAVWHSRLTARQRNREWLRVAAGECPIVVGARSAVFAPLRRVGLIIIDEEHETSYKQEGVPRYHAREVALARARLAKATVVLGSATPAVETYYAAQRERIRLVTLPERVAGRTLPRVEIVDMREELAARHRVGPFSRRLQQAIEQTIDRREQAMLLLNRRGFARVAQCQTCGTVVRCARCAVPLVYHATRQALVCHYCDFHLAPPDVCDHCRKGYLRFRGSGTERVESELHRLFPLVSTLRMDRDTTKGKEAHRQMYDAVSAQEVGVLVGTQMIAKGLDFPQVTLVGVISADTALNLPDFRAGERTFDLLTQVAGRSGRGDTPGRVMIQTYCPSHYAIQAASQHDYARFYAEEIRMRRRLKLPPFAHLVELMLVGSSKQRVQDCAQRLAGELAREAKPARITILGPAPHRIARLRRNYRMCVLLKARAVEPMAALLRRTLQPGRRFGGMPVMVNVDPL